MLTSWAFRATCIIWEGFLVPGDFPEDLMKGVIERGEEEAREIAEAERADKRRASRDSASVPGRKKMRKAGEA